MKLYELADHYNQLAEMMETVDDIELIRDTLDSLDDAFDAKAENIVKLMRSKAAVRDVIDAERRRLDERARRLDRECEWLKNYLENQMIRTGKTKVDSSLFSIALSNNRPSVHILDQNLIPSEYITVKFVDSVDKNSIYDAIKAGKEVPGVEIVQTKSLKVR